MADRRRRRRNSSHSDSDHSETDEAPIPKVTETRKTESECESEHGASEVASSVNEEVSEYESATETNDDEYTDEETTEYDEDSVVVEGSEFDDESWIEEERQSGDGEEQPVEGKEKNLDDDEDQKNPAYIPRKGAFYEHDSRLGEDGEEKRLDPNAKKRLWLDAEKWEHDKFNDSMQAPKSREELITMYGFDIREAERPPEADPRFRGKPRGRRSDQGPRLGDYIKGDNQNRRYRDNYTDNYNPRGRGGSSSRGRFDSYSRGNRGGPRGRGSYDGGPPHPNFSQQKSYNELRNQYQDRGDRRDNNEREYENNRQNNAPRGRGDSRQYRGKSTSPERYRRTNDTRSYNQERRYSGPPSTNSGSSPNANTGQEDRRPPFANSRDRRGGRGGGGWVQEPPVNRESSDQERPVKKTLTISREDEIIPILTTEIVTTNRTNAQYTQAGSQRTTRPSGSAGPSPKPSGSAGPRPSGGAGTAPTRTSGSPPSPKPQPASGSKPETSREARPKRYSSQRQRAMPESGYHGEGGDVSHTPGQRQGQGNMKNVPSAVYYTGVYPNPGAPEFRPHVEPTSRHQPVSNFPAPPMIRQPPIMGTGPYTLPVSSSIQSPPRMFHQPVSAASGPMQSGQPMLQRPSGPFIPASIVNYGPPGLPPGVTGPPPGHFPLVQFTSQPPSMPPQAAVVQPPAQEGPVQVRGGTTYFQPEAQTVRDVRGGTVYFNPNIQHMPQRSSPIRRPKLAIPIVNPEEIAQSDGDVMVEDDEEDFVDAEEGDDIGYEMVDRDDAATPTPETGVPSDNPYYTEGNGPYLQEEQGSYHPEEEGPYPPDDEGPYPPNESPYPPNYLGVEPSPGTYTHQENTPESLLMENTQTQGSGSIEQTISHDSISESIIEQNLSESISYSEASESAELPTDKLSGNTVATEIVGSMSLDISGTDRPVNTVDDRVSDSGDIDLSVDNMRNACSSVSPATEGSRVPDKVVTLREETVPSASSESDPSADTTSGSSSLEHAQGTTEVMSESSSIDQSMITSNDHSASSSDVIAEEASSIVSHDPDSIESKVSPTIESSDIFQETSSSPLPVEVLPVEANPVFLDTNASSTAELTSSLGLIPTEDSTENAEPSMKNENIESATNSPSSTKDEETHRDTSDKPLEGPDK